MDEVGQGAVGARMGCNGSSVFALPFGRGHSRYDIETPEVFLPFVQTSVWEVEIVKACHGMGFWPLQHVDWVPQGETQSMTTSLAVKLVQ